MAKKKKAARGPRYTARRRVARAAKRVVRRSPSDKRLLDLASDVIREDQEFLLRLARR